MAEHQLPKLNTRVRFPSSAPSSTWPFGPFPFPPSRAGPLTLLVKVAAEGYASPYLMIVCWRFVSSAANPTRLRLPTCPSSSCRRNLPRMRSSKRSMPRSRFWWSSPRESRCRTVHMCGPITWKKVEVRRNSGIAPTLLEQRCSRTALRLRQRTTWMQKSTPQKKELNFSVQLPGSTSPPPGRL